MLITKISIKAKCDKGTMKREKETAKNNSSAYRVSGRFTCFTY